MKVFLTTALLLSCALSSVTAIRAGSSDDLLPPIRRNQKSTKQRTYDQYDAYFGGSGGKGKRLPSKSGDEDGSEKDLFLGIFMQPPAYGGNCATMKMKYDTANVVVQPNQGDMSPSSSSPSDNSIHSIRNRLKRRMMRKEDMLREKDEEDDFDIYMFDDAGDSFADAAQKRRNKVVVDRLNNKDNINRGLHGGDASRSSSSSSMAMPRVTLPPDSNATCCVSSYYVRWAESVGMRVVPIRTDAPDEELYWLLDRVNGVLFTGGIILDDPDVMRHYVSRATIIYNYALNKFNGNGTTNNGNPAREHFPLWGTCQGFEILHIVIAGGYDKYFKILQTNFTGMNPLMLNVDFMPNALENPANTMVYGAPPLVIDSLRYRNTTLNYHTKGIPPSVYDPSSPNFYPQVAKVLTPLAVSKDTSGQPFIAAAQGKGGFPIFVVQFHPEKPSYDFTSLRVGHDVPTLAVAQNFAFFLRDEMRRNNHSFASRLEANGLVINNYPSFNMGYGLQYYFV